MGPFGLAPKGTVSRRMLPLARALVRGSMAQVTAVIPPWDAPQDAGRVWTDQGVPVVHVPLRGGAPGILAALLRVTLAQQPAVVHCFKPKGYPGLLLWLLWQARQAGLWHGRLVVDMDDWETGWNDRLPYPAPLRAVFAWQEAWCVQHADGVTAASRWLASLAAGLRDGNRPVWHVPNGVENSRFSPSSSLLPRHPPTALLYTRFVEVTPLHVQRIWRRVRQQLPDARLVVAGDSLPAGQAARLRAMTGPAAGLHSLGWVPELALPGVFGAAGVAWVPGASTLVARARCSVKLVEVMAAGLPVVADASGEVLTYVRPAVEGLLVTPGDDGATVQALADLLTDASRAVALGQAAAARIRDTFTWDHLACPVAALYQELDQ